MIRAGWERCRKSGIWIWRHRTKTVGGLGICAGAIQTQLASHPELHLPREGTVLMFFGAIVAMVGTYNSLASFFGWTDPPP